MTIANLEDKPLKFTIASLHNSGFLEKMAATPHEIGVIIGIAVGSTFLVIVIVIIIYIVCCRNKNEEISS